MSTSYDGIEDLLKTQDSLQKNLDTLLGATNEACTEIEVPQSQQQDSFKQRPQPSTSAKDVVCNKCQHTGHYAKNCTSTFSKTGKFLGTGLPHPNHHWTKKNAADAKAKKAAMVNTPPQQQHQQQQQQQQQSTERGNNTQDA
jgi:NCAIR mutase (PurE)-related protein